MSNIAAQVHGRFKIFSGALEAGNSIATLASEVETFACGGTVAPKSIGVEYLEHAKKVIVTLGYRDDEHGYPVRLRTVSLGKASTLDAAGLHTLEARMEEAARHVENVICHELFVTENDEFLMVFMSHGAA